MSKHQVTACVDGSAMSGAVCDTAVWASRALQAPVTFLHLLEASRSPAIEDYSGAIGMGSREHLLSELVALDEDRSSRSLEQGRRLLDKAIQAAQSAGITDVSGEQRYDELLDAMLAYEDATRLFVIGRHGETHASQAQAIGAQVESVVRAVHTPILMTPDVFSPPRNFMLAYDGSETADKAIERVARSPLLAGMPGQVVMVGADTGENQARLHRACQLLVDRNWQVQSHLLQGNVMASLVAFQQDHSTELQVMGAYGHSRIREFIVGSNTTKMLTASSVPVLILR